MSDMFKYEEDTTRVRTSKNVHDQGIMSFLIDFAILVRLRRRNLKSSSWWRSSHLHSLILLILSSPHSIHHHHLVWLHKLRLLHWAHHLESHRISHLVCHWVLHLVWHNLGRHWHNLVWVSLVALSRLTHLKAWGIVALHHALILLVRDGLNYHSWSLHWWIEVNALWSHRGHLHQWISTGISSLFLQLSLIVLLLCPWLLFEAPFFISCLPALPLGPSSNEPLLEAELECELIARSEGRYNEDQADGQAGNAEALHVLVLELEEVAELVPCLDCRIAILRYVGIQVAT